MVTDLAQLVALPPVTCPRPWRDAREPEPSLIAWFCGSKLCWYLRDHLGGTPRTSPISEFAPEAVTRMKVSQLCLSL